LEPFERSINLNAVLYAGPEGNGLMATMAVVSVAGNADVLVGIS
jgi:hypothetical protein